MHEADDRNIIRITNFFNLIKENIKTCVIFYRENSFYVIEDLCRSYKMVIEPEIVYLYKASIPFAFIKTNRNFYNFVKIIYNIRFILTKTMFVKFIRNRIYKHFETPDKQQ